MQEADSYAAALALVEARVSAQPASDATGHARDRSPMLCEHADHDIARARRGTGLATTRPPSCVTSPTRE
jgi:hypothetical protein